MTGAATFLALAVVALVQAPESAPPVSIELSGKLYRAVFSPGPGTLTANDLAAVPEPARERLNRFLARRAAFTSRYTHEASSFEQARVDAKKREIERAIVALIDAPGIEDRALDFVKSAPISVDWQGKWEGPLTEAAAAEEFLKGTPSSPLAPYLYAFIAHRQRAAFEAYAKAQNADGMKTSSKKYRTFLQRARSSSDPIFTMIADDLDRQTHVYLKSEHHPATYDPDT